ncbi:hypothetical protein XELAEV_18045008mg [Xenopus laevis]|uniref:C2H2-type domain-containing protein n=1 Tax=Xenopus laevis TaxID=8355 RepID=A0A974BZM5_XENLA|nr:hypothetical protein XELAEV_18045008mg [Xenopus laevis]
MNMDGWKKTPCVKDSAEVLLIDGTGVTTNEKGDDSHSVCEIPTKCGDLRSNTLADKIDGNDTCSSKKEEQFKCTVCGKLFHWPSHLRHHMQSHTNERPYKCSVCHKGFKDGHKLNRHQQMHPEFKQDFAYRKVYKCYICDKPFKFQSDLDKHTLIHSEEKPFKCPICSVGFRRLDHLKRHNFVHTSDRPFKCSICGRGFVEATEVLKHERIHSGDKPYKCKFCDKSFYHPRSLKEHSAVKHALAGEEMKKIYSDDVLCKLPTTKEKAEQYPEDNRTEQVDLECHPSESGPHEIVVYLSDDD